MSPTHRVAAAVFCVAATVGLTACNTAEIGAAAVVGDVRITVAELQEQVRELADSLPDSAGATGDQSIAQHAILQRMIQSELLALVAAEEGVEVSEADIDAYIDEQVLSQAPDGDIGPLLAQNNLTEDSLRDAVRDQLMAAAMTERLGGQEQLVEVLTAKADEIGVTVSPRYGTWNGIVLEQSSGSISEPETVPTETPAG
ncbi:MAG TPA: SurA N-terminal domain-containing protein [Jiangellaceae bacterium]|nr:SurA N-terminal domain-containing protein [Jiangellaceae bacterium]